MAVLELKLSPEAPGSGSRWKEKASEFWTSLLYFLRKAVLSEIRICGERMRFLNDENLQEENAGGFHLWVLLHVKDRGTSGSMWGDPSWSWEEGGESRGEGPGRLSSSPLSQVVCSSLVTMRRCGFALAPTGEGGVSRWLWVSKWLREVSRGVQTEPELKAMGWAAQHVWFHL